jgi:hypothetical protein
LKGGEVQGYHEVQIFPMDPSIGSHMEMEPGWKPFSAGVGYVVARKWVRLTELPEHPTK